MEYETRVGFAQLGQIIWILEILTGNVLSTIPPRTVCAFALRCFLTTLIPFTIALFFPGITKSTSPVLLRLLPDSILTVSPFLIFIKPLEQEKLFFCSLHHVFLAQPDQRYVFRVVFYRRQLSQQHFHRILQRCRQLVLLALPGVR